MKNHMLIIVIVLRISNSNEIRALAVIASRQVKGVPVVIFVGVKMCLSINEVERKCVKIYFCGLYCGCRFCYYINVPLTVYRQVTFAKN